MTEDKEDGSITASGDSYSQSECHVYYIIMYIMYSHQKIPCLTEVLFQENKSFGASYHLHSSSDVHEAGSRTIRSKALGSTVHTEIKNNFENNVSLIKVKTIRVQGYHLSRAISITEH